MNSLSNEFNGRKVRLMARMGKFSVYFFFSRNALTFAYYYCERCLVFTLAVFYPQVFFSSIETK